MKIKLSIAQAECYEFQTINEAEWKVILDLFTPKKRHFCLPSAGKALSELLKDNHNNPVHVCRLTEKGLYPDTTRNSMNAKFKISGLPYRVVILNKNFYLLVKLKSTG